MAQHRRIVAPKGGWVRTTVDLAADAVGDPAAAEALALPVGTLAQVRATPDTNSGYYEIAVGFTLYDCAPHEIERADPPHDKPALLKETAAKISGSTKECGAGARDGSVVETTAGGALVAPSTRQSLPESKASGQAFVKLCGGCEGTKMGTLRCTRCYSRWYCSKDCQRNDWPKHRKACKAQPKKANIGAQPTVPAKKTPIITQPLAKPTAAAVEWMRGVKLWCEALKRSSGGSSSRSQEESRGQGGPISERHERTTAAALIKQALTCFKTSIGLEDSAKAEASRTALAAGGVATGVSSSSSSKALCESDDFSSENGAPEGEAAAAALSRAGAAAVAAAVAHLQQHRADAEGRAQRRLFLGVSLLDLEDDDDQSNDKTADTIEQSGSVSTADCASTSNVPETNTTSRLLSSPGHQPPQPVHPTRAEQGLALLREAIAANPTCAAAYLELVVALEEGKRCQEAREVATQAIANCSSAPLSSSSSNLCSPFADPWQRPGFRDPSLRAMAWWPLDAVPFCAELTRDVEVVQKEFRALLANNPHALPRNPQGSSLDEHDATGSSSSSSGGSSKSTNRNGSSSSSGSCNGGKGSWEPVGGGKRDGAGAHDGTVVGSTRLSSSSGSSSSATNESTSFNAADEYDGVGSSSSVGSSVGSSSGSDSESAMGAWHEIVLLGRGAPVQCPAPETVALLRRVAPAACDLCDQGAGEVIFSLLAPYTRISPHCAPSNVRLTAHLALLVPPIEAGCCDLRVGSEPPRRWTEGQVLLFDDSFEHEVVNDTPFPRAVLLVRFWHPDLATPERRVKALTSAHDAREACFRLRQLPPLPGSGGAQLHACATGALPCPTCGMKSSDNWALSFGSPGSTEVCGTCVRCNTTVKNSLFHL